MSEHELIQATEWPVTLSSLKEELDALGVREGDTVIVHSSLSSLGWVCGGPQTVVQALMAAVGSGGTVVMPAQSGDWSDPAGWGNPAVPQEWIEIIYKEMPAFDPAVTPTREMGRIAELFRTFPGTMRSSHPQSSFSANGRQAAYITAEHPLTPQFGEASPLGKLYELDAKVLLLGAGYDSCTSFHLAETQLDGMPEKQMGTAMLEQGERVWKTFTDYAYDADDFADLGADMEGRVAVKLGRIGRAECRLFSVKEAVDYAKAWLADNRPKG
ncbi:aminoglycoside N(3)-acetyltransferase [Paenibacillus sambharensis]|uniref:Aminoglycoside N(3)-acetyltransferase n=1 Tax=Paenibacillus sambharensis TaxID=1803190 RepID=A0A2W1L2D4_9BACL|nr:AAC(3) family N-acetyltransferase [Paenibacillus sambharensis]PZD93059.1 aminoglycoside N(3)-acetyltransferase [Paenibacillus sambharensis]